MKYKLINSVSKKETICDKVVVDGWDYYVSDEFLRIGDYGYWEDADIISQISDLTAVLPTTKKVIATTNPNIDVLQILEEPNETLIHQIAADLGYRMIPDDLEEGIKAGYKESQETHPFSEEDMIEFGKFCHNDAHSAVNKVKTFKELLQLWREQKPKIVYYE